MINYPYDPWCNTCGKDIPMSTWDENDGECDSCKKFWEEWREHHEIELVARNLDPNFG